MKHVVNLSGGACSFWGADRVLAQPDVRRDDVTLLFADTLIEDKQLYKFNDWTAEYFGIPITRVSLEMTPWELFRKEGMIGNDRAPICSIRLKREPLWNWVYNTYPVEVFLNQVTVYVGFDWTEVNRLDDLRAEHPQVRIEAPMTEPPYWDKCKIISEMEALVGWMPDAYKQGFPHFNCGKRCIRAGISHFVHLYHVDRPAFDEWANEEIVTNEEFRNRGIESEFGEFSILRDRRGGVTKPLSLKTLAARIEAGETFRKDDWGGCGCGTTN